MSAAIVALICIYVAGFAWSWGPLGWLVPSEIQVGARVTTGDMSRGCQRPAVTHATAA